MVCNDLGITWGHRLIYVCRHYPFTWRCDRSAAVANIRACFTRDVIVPPAFA